MDCCLIFNAGSSSLKWTAIDGGDRTIGEGNEPLTETSASALERLVRKAAGHAPLWHAAGHRIVHGGTRFEAPVQVDTQIRSELERLVIFDPLHMRVALDLLDAARRVLPDITHVAVFDTAFHRTLPPAAAGYALPREWTERWPLRRFGFHGLSVEWSVLRASSFLGVLPKRIIVAHLGSGCSMTAVHEGRSIDTTMGFTPLDGLMMGTRCGALDPGLLLYLQSECGIGIATMQDALARNSGLLGVSGVSADIRAVIKAAAAGNEAARLAYERFILYGRRALGAMSGSLGGVDAVVFTGGIGEHSAQVRHDLMLALGPHLIEQRRNEAARVDDSAADADVIEVGTDLPRVLVIGAREDRIMARDVRAVAHAARV